MSCVPQKKDSSLVEENGVINDDEMKISLVQKNSDSSFRCDGSSSFIGLMSDGDGGGEEEDSEEAQSKAVEGSLISLASLEDALPIKQGLSSYYKGRSRSFMNLAEVKCVEEMEEEESPLNKRRRLTIAQNKSSSFYKWSSSSSSMPHLTLNDGENTHTGIEQADFRSNTSSTSFSSINSPTKPSID